MTRLNPRHKWLLNIQPAAQQSFDRLSFVEMLQAKKFERVRKFRVSDYRIFFAVEVSEITYQGHSYTGTLFLLDICDRKEAY
jgi:mRNA-degrading endonuclease RelE of RelBE toxin-antitoxin system